MIIKDLLEGKGDLQRTKPALGIARDKIEQDPAYRVAAQSSFALYRGIEKTDPILHGNSLSAERPSANTSNYFTLLCSYLLPSWKGWPQRSKSFICTTNESTASNYGLPYRVYPKGDPLIAFCPANDFWESFETHAEKWLDFNGVDDLNGKLKSLFNVADRAAMSGHLHRFDKAWNYARQTQSIPETPVFDRIVYSGLFHEPFNENLISHFPSFTALLSHFFDPLENGFKTAKLSQLGHIATDNEVWFSGEAYFIDS
jgi:hypothetical protein